MSVAGYRLTDGELRRRAADRARAEARQAHGVNPRLVTRQGVKIVVYSRTRVYLDRDAWDMLPADGVLLLQVRPPDGGAYSLAFTAAELAAVFGEVRSTRSWDQARCYHLPLWTIRGHGAAGFPARRGGRCAQGLRERCDRRRRARSGPPMLSPTRERGVPFEAPVPLLLK